MPNTPRPCVVGVDDRASRKGRTYRTIVVNIERRCPPRPSVRPLGRDLGGLAPGTEMIGPATLIDQPETNL